MNSEKQSTNLQMTLREVNRVGEVKKNIPKLRFKGYEDAWEQRKVAEITKFHKQGYYTTEEYNDNKKYYLLRGTDLTGNKLVLKDTPKIDATEKDYDAFKTEIGDFLIVRSGNVGTYGIVDIDIPAIFGSYLIDFRFDTEKVTNEFFGYFYQSERFQSQLNKITQSSANININAENIKSTYISLPVLIEQKKISNIMSTLDNCITLHQRKYDALKSMKKTLLSKMFPKNGEVVPEIRFKGYTDAWEQRKLGSEFKKVNERNDGTFGKEHWISVAKMYFQDPDKVQSNNIDTRTYVMRLGDIAFEGHPNNEFQFGRFVANDIGDGVVSELFPVYRHKNQYYNNYWKYAIQQEHIMAPIFAKSITSSGNSSNKLDPKHFLRQKIRIATLEEQKNIGDFLVEIDNLITLHQRRSSRIIK